MNKAIAQSLCLMALVTFSLPVEGQRMPFPAENSRSKHALEQVRLSKGAAVYRSEQTISQYNDELNWINDTRTKHYFQGGLLRRQSVETWEGHVFGDWVLTEQTDFEYDHNGALVMETRWVMVDSALTPATRIFYDDEDANLLVILEQEFHGEGGWIPVSRESFTLADGYAVEGLTEIWIDPWLETERFSLEEVNGDVVETVQVYDGQNWTNSERRTYNGLTIEYLYRTLDQLMIDVVDYSGMWYGLRFPETLQQEWIDGAWVNISRTDTEIYFDLMTGALLEEITTMEEWVDDAWSPTTQMFIAYGRPPNTVGVPGRTTIRSFENGEWVDMFVEKYIIQVDILRIVQATVEMDLGSGFAEVSRVLIDWVALDGLAVDPTELPHSFELAQNAPNPFNPSTRINFRLDEAQPIRLAVYDMIGREVALLDSGLRPAGEYSVRWEATGMPSGTYIYRLDVGGDTQSKTMVLLK